MNSGDVAPECRIPHSPAQPPHFSPGRPPVAPQVVGRSDERQDFAGRKVPRGASSTRGRAARSPWRSSNWPRGGRTCHSVMTFATKILNPRSRVGDPTLLPGQRRNPDTAGGAISGAGHPPIMRLISG